MNKRVILNKRNLLILVRDKGDCGYINCNDANCSTCVCRYSTSSVYSFAIKTFLKRYGESELFELLL